MDERDKISSLASQAAVIKRVTIGGMIVNILLSAAKLVGGILGSSQAVAADGVHSLTDCVTDVAILLGVRYWSKPPDQCHPYGHRRIETIVTALIGGALVITAVGLAWHAVETVFEPTKEPPGLIALAAAVTSIVSKEILYQWTRKASKQVGSTAMAANAWHHRSDALSSIPAAGAVIAARIDPSLVFLDGIGAGLVSIFIIHAAWRIIGPALTELTDRAAPERDVRRITESAASVAGVEDVHRVRTRLIGPGVQVDMHITVADELTVLEGHEIATAIQARLLEEGPGILDVMVHVEPHSEHEPEEPGGH